MCVCVCKTHSWRLESRLFTPHPTFTYTCGVTTAPRVRGGLHTSC